MKKQNNPDTPDGVTPSQPAIKQYENWIHNQLDEIVDAWHEDEETSSSLADAMGFSKGAHAAWAQKCTLPPILQACAAEMCRLAQEHQSEAISSADDEQHPFKAMSDMVTKHEKLIKEAQEVFTAEVQAIANKHGVHIATGHMSDYWKVKKLRGRKWLQERCNDKHPALDDLRALEKVAEDLRIGPSNMMAVSPK